MGGKRTTAVVLAALICLWVVPAARANDRVFWTDETLSKIASAGLDNSGAANFPISGTAITGPEGVSLDPAGNRIFWGNFAGSMPNRVSRANLDDGTGGQDIPPGSATLANPRGVNFDPTSNRLYWANTAGSSDSISFVGFSGGSGNINTSSTGITDPFGLAVDSGAGRVYFANTGLSKISFANLDGSGGGNVNTAGATVASPVGVALDKAAGRIYWANSGASGPISFANLNGSGGGNLSITGVPVTQLGGVAVDAAANRIYWANNGPPSVKGIFFADLSTGAGAAVNVSGISLADMTFPTLLESPEPAGKPQINADGANLKCAGGSWAADLPEAQLYQAPRSSSLQWSRDGTDLQGATTDSLALVPTGLYRCRLTATNAAGTTTQSSDPFGKFTIGKLKRNRRTGTATLSVDVPSAGTLSLTGRGVVKQRADRPGVISTARTVSKAGTVKLKIKGKSKTRRKLAKNGKANVKVTLFFTPPGGTPNSQTKTVKLIKRR